MTPLNESLSSESSNSSAEKILQLFSQSFPSRGLFYNIFNNKRLIYAPHITLNMDDPPNWSNKMSRCSAAHSSPLSFFGFWNLIPLHIHLQTSNHSTGGRFLQHRPLLGPINLWWEQWLITREQEKIRPLRYWWFTIQFRGVNREPYLNCQCLIYTSCSCTKSAAAFLVWEGC